MHVCYLNLHLLTMYYYKLQWTNIWSGNNDEEIVLQDQFFPANNHSRIEKHYQFLRRYFHHPNYVKIANRPVFITYMSYTNRNFIKLLAKLNSFAIKDGFPEGIYFIKNTGSSLHPTEVDTQSESEKNIHSRGLNLPSIGNDIYSAGIFYPNAPETKINPNPRRVPRECLQGQRTSGLTKPQYFGIISGFDNLV